MNTENTDVALSFAPPTPALVLTDQEQRQKFFEDMRAKVAEFVPDVSTATGRKEVAAMAYKVTRTKTAIDDAGKKLTEDARKMIAKVNLDRSALWDELDALAKKVRQPLTAWEEAEKNRAAKEQEIRDRVQVWSTIPHEANSEFIADCLETLKATEVDPEIFGQEASLFRTYLDERIRDVVGALARTVRAEQDAAELAQLRRLQQEHQDAERRKQEEEARAREAAEKAEADRLAEVRRAQEKAELEAQLAAKAAADLAEAEAQAREDERRKADEILAAERARAERLEKELADRAAELEAQAQAKKAEEEAAAKAEAERQADKAHRGRIMSTVKLALMTVPGVDENVARSIVLAIIAGAVPHTRIEF